MREITLGSLFDGIGGFPLAASRYGIKAIWASEIELFPIKVTKLRFPEMEHLGDITKIDGTSIASVDIVTFGSPCQDLSVAGKRAGLAGERSGLFMEAIRIIKEMRNTHERTNKPIRPRFAVWENVPGAFSSNKGEDFRAVLEEICCVKDETVIIPEPPNGKWSTVGAVMGNGYSVAWRTIDAQFWGVPQRRRRIFLVADFGGQSAPEVLFKRQGLRRDFAESGEARERIAADAERSFRETGPGYWGEGIGCLRAEGENRPSRPSNVVVAIDSNCQDSRFKLTGQVVPTIPAKSGTGGNNGPMLAIPINTQIATRGNKLGERTGFGIGEQGDPAYTIQEAHSHAVAYGIGAHNSEGMKSDNPHSGVYEANTSRTLDLNGGNPACNQGGIAIVQVLNDQGGSQMDVSENVVGTLRAEMHGNIPAMCAGFNGYKSVTGSIQYQEDTAATLEANMPSNVATYSFQRSDEFKESDVASTEYRRQHKDATDLVVAGCDFRSGKENGDLCATLQAKPNGGKALTVFIL
jgi:DNA (cytosine-5)-methyltransferase 1